MRPLLLVALMLLGLAGSFTTAAAEEPEPSPAAAALQRQPAPDFLFGAPRGSVGLRGSWTLLRAESDWYDFVSRELTLDRDDFRTAGIAADVGVTVAPRLDAVVTVEYGSRTTPSEARNWLENGLPILQTTEMRQTVLSGGVRVPLSPPGRDVSSLAWVPNRWVPYIGGGAGALYYKVRQYGDFVEPNGAIFTDAFESAGWTPMAYLNGGLGIQLVRRLYLSVDARYQWADARLGTSSFVGFEPLDLSGVRLSTGINVLF